MAYSQVMDKDDIEFSIIDNVITKSIIGCRYCGDRIEGNSDPEVLVELIYHIHDIHTEQQRLNKWDILP